MAEANIVQRKKRVNKPPIFSGVRKELKGFLTIVDLNFEDEPEDFPDDKSKIRFIMSYLAGDPLDWASNLKNNNDPLIEDVEEFKKELTNNYGDPEVDEIVANGKLDNIRQKKYGHAFEYINEFKAISKNSDFNESAKIYMFLKGLHYKMREQLAVVNPNPKSLIKLFTDVLQIENLSKRNNLAEFYFNQQRIRNYQSNSNKRVNSQDDDPMDVDLFKIKQHTRFSRYTPMDNQKFYRDNKRDLSEEKKKGLCFLCRQPGHLQFNCPNRKRPKSVKLANKVKENPENAPSAKVRRIRVIKDSDDAQKIRTITEEENTLSNKKNNIITFFIKTNDIDEVPVKVLIDSGSDSNFIHPKFINDNKIKLEEIKKPFNVTGLGYGVSTIYEQTEKCILRLRNHYEVIQLFALNIPDVDIILGIPWIEKHCPMNYHDSRKISFPSGYCARHCNEGKRKRKNKKKTKGKPNTNKKCKIEEDIVANDTSQINNSYKRKHLWDSDSESEEEYVKGRKIRTINDSDSDSDSDSDNNSNSNSNSIRSNSNRCNNIIKSCKYFNSCNCNKNLNKDENLVAEPVNYPYYCNNIDHNWLCYLFNLNNKYNGVKDKRCYCNFIKEETCKNDDKINSSSNKVNLSLIPSHYSDFVEVFNEKNCDILPPHREYDCEIKLKDNSNLFYGPIYPLTEAERDELKKYIKENLDKGFIRKSKSPAGAPVLFVKKKDGSLRLVVDYRKLNEITIRNSYPLPLISELIDRVKGAKYFTKLDLKSAYNLVRIKEGDEFKTAFRTRYGHYEYLVMPFGLKNAPATFQHFINDVLSDYLDDFVISYIDDILIYSNSLEEHHEHVRKVLKKLLDNNLFVKLEKCEFDVTETSFLGYVISKDGLKADPEKINAILKWPVPTTVKEVQSFIGLCNYYRIFIKDFAKIASPIHKLTRKNVPFNWGPDQQAAFDKLKSLFTSAPILKNPDSNKPFVVETDASNFAVGAVLSQEFDGKLHPIAFISSSLTKSERNYPIYDKELLAIKVALEEWRHFLEGARHPFTIYTDHKNLTFPRKPEMLSQRQIRWYEFLSRFEFNLVYRAGKKSGKPDLLSRRSDHLFNYSNNVSCCVVNCFKINEDTLINSILNSLKDDEFYIKIKSFLENNNDFSVPPYRNIDKFKCDKEGFLLFNNLIYVPQILRTRVLELHHDSVSAGHFGISKTIDLICRNFWWPKLSIDVKNFIKSCDICCKSKIPRHKPYGLLSPLSTPNRAWSDLSMDFIVELPKSKDMTTIMVVVDRLTKMAHFIPFRCLPTASIAADAFINYIFKLHGFPDFIISDRGSQFTSEFWNRLCDLLDIKHSLSTANHPQTDGQTERVNGILEQYLRCFINERQNNWVDLLPFAEFAYNNTLQQSINQSPFFANYGFNPKFNPEIPSNGRPNRAEKRIMDINHNIIFLKKNLEEAKKTYKKYADMKRLPSPDFDVGKKVWLLKGSTTKNVKRKLADQLIGPFEIVKKVSPLAYELKLPSNMHCHPVFHVSLLEPYYENEFKDRNYKRKKNIHLTTDTNEKLPEKIIKMRTYKGKNRYLISWKGPNEYEDTWIDEDQISDKQLIQEYFRKLKKTKSSVRNNAYTHNENHSNEYMVKHRYQPFVIELPSRYNPRRSLT
ncbi:MAG: hypothetical protein E7180_06615 [Erysipelotrichaceae bacterium]|nr:hypothetical protein [Erysipelotrichaceae bacterium]